MSIFVYCTITEHTSRSGDQYCHLICLFQPIQLNLPFVEYHIVCVYTYAPHIKYIMYYVSSLSVLILMTSVDVNVSKKIITMSKSIMFKGYKFIPHELIIESYS